MDDFTTDLSKVLRYNAEERAAFEKAIDENPLESTNHLVYADWLQENGEHEEAEFRRAMGEWVKDGKLSIKDSMHRGFPYRVRNVHLPQWMDYEQVPSVHDTPHTTEEDAEGNLVPEDHSLFREYYVGGNSYFGPVREAGWRSYRGMESAFRKAFTSASKS